MSAQLKPITVFEDNVRPALLMLDVYKILRTDNGPVDTHELLDRIKAAIGTEEGEELLLLQSELFVGLIRERANITKGRLKPKALCNLLRQAIVCSATALETFLPGMLRYYLADAIQYTQRDFLSGRKAATDWMQKLTWSTSDLMDIWGTPPEEMANRVARKIHGFSDFNILGGIKGVEVVGCLLQLDDPWSLIAGELKRNEEDLKSATKQVIDRRNDIVHRADRAYKDADGDQQEITHEWTQHGVDTINHVCHCLSTLASAKIEDIKTTPQEAPAMPAAGAPGMS